MKDYKNVIIFDHPLIRHKIAILRDNFKQFNSVLKK